MSYRIKRGDIVVVRMSNLLQKIPLFPPIFPFCGAVRMDWCRGLLYNHGLHTQCTNPLDSMLGSTLCFNCCLDHKNGNSLGRIETRLDCNVLDYIDVKGRSTKPFHEVIQKMNIKPQWDAWNVYALKTYGVVMPWTHRDRSHVVQPTSFAAKGLVMNAICCYSRMTRSADKIRNGTILQSWGCLLCLRKLTFSLKYNVTFNFEECNDLNAMKRQYQHQHQHQDKHTTEKTEGKDIGFEPEVTYKTAQILNIRDHRALVKWISTSSSLPSSSSSSSSSAAPSASSSTSSSASSVVPLDRCVKLEENSLNSLPLDDTILSIKTSDEPARSKVVPSRSIDNLLSCSVTQSMFGWDAREGTGISIFHDPRKCVLCNQGECRENSKNEREKNKGKKNEGKKICGRLLWLDPGWIHYNCAVHTHGVRMDHNGRIHNLQQCLTPLYFKQFEEEDGQRTEGNERNGKNETNDRNQQDEDEDANKYKTNQSNSISSSEKISSFSKRFGKNHETNGSIETKYGNVNLGGFSSLTSSSSNVPQAYHSLSVCTGCGRTGATIRCSCSSDSCRHLRHYSCLTPHEISQETTSQATSHEKSHETLHSQSNGTPFEKPYATSFEKKQEKIQPSLLVRSTLRSAVIDHIYMAPLLLPHQLVSIENTARPPLSVYSSASSSSASSASFASSASSSSSLDEVPTRKRRTIFQWLDEKHIFRAGTLTVLCTGSLSNEKLINVRMHSKNEIYPDGYKSVRIHWSRNRFKSKSNESEKKEGKEGKEGKERVAYYNEIVLSENGQNLLFRITPSDDMVTYVGSTPQEALDLCIRSGDSNSRSNNSDNSNKNNSSNKNGKNENFSNSFLSSSSSSSSSTLSSSSLSSIKKDIIHLRMSSPSSQPKWNGVTFFGLNYPEVRAALERLPNAAKTAVIHSSSHKTKTSDAALSETNQKGNHSNHSTSVPNDAIAPYTFLFKPPTINETNAARSAMNHCTVHTTNDSSCLRTRSRWNATERIKLNRMFNVRNASSTSNNSSSSSSNDILSSEREMQKMQEMQEKRTTTTAAAAAADDDGSHNSSRNSRSSSRNTNGNNTNQNNGSHRVEHQSSVSSSSSSSSPLLNNFTSVGDRRLDSPVSDGDSGEEVSNGLGGGIIQQDSNSTLSMRYRQMKEETLTKRIRVTRSSIHGWGVFARRDILMDEIIAEYVGEAVRPVVADRRENEYDRQHSEGGLMGGCYMFRVDKEEIIDATRKGNHARFINHSCNANAYAKIGVLPDMSSHIFVFALRTIYEGEEVTYDYQFPLEDSNQLECNCGSVNCSRRMN